MGTKSIIPEFGPGERRLNPSTVWATNRPQAGAAVARELNADNALTNNSSVDRLETFKPNIRGSRKQPLIMRYPIDLGSERTEVPHVMQFKIYWRWENPEIADAAPKIKFEAETRERNLTAQSKADEFVSSLLDFGDSVNMAEIDSESFGVKGVLRDPLKMNPVDPSKDSKMAQELMDKSVRDSVRRSNERALRSAQDRVVAINEDVTANQNGAGWGETDITPATTQRDNNVLEGRFNAILAGIKDDTVLGEVKQGLENLGLKQRDPVYDQMVSIYLPMCTRINNEDTFGYTDMDMKIPAGALKVLSNLNASQSFQQFSAGFMDAAKQGAAGYITSALSNTAFAGVVPSLTGLVLNPRIEKMFQQKDLRQFTFSWDFYPRSEDEVRSVKDIIDTFRYHSHPSRTRSGDINNQELSDDPQIMLRVPAEFTVTFLSSQNNENGSSYVENEYIPKISRFVITSISVDYTPNGVFSTLKDNSPTAYTFTIGVSEIAQLTREDVETGF